MTSVNQCNRWCFTNATEIFSKTKRCLRNFQFLCVFQLTYMENRWSNQTKAIEHFEKVVLPFLQKIKVENGYPKEQMSLIIMDTFKEQDNDEMRKFWAENSKKLLLFLAT